MKGKEPGENKGYAFVTFKTKELASKAMEKLNNTVLKVNLNYFFLLSFPSFPVLLYEQEDLHELVCASNTIIIYVFTYAN